MKILILSDLHIGTSQESTTNPGIYRQANTQAYENLARLIPQFNAANYDLVINLGDFLSEVKPSHEPDAQKRGSMNLKNMRDVLGLLQGVKVQTINLPGNHDISSFGLEKLRELLGEFSLDNNFSGVKDFGNFRLIWTDLDLSPERIASFGTERIAWLKEQLDFPGKIIIFSHYPFILQDTRGNFYFNSNPAGFVHSDWEELSEVVIGADNVVACINGHTHWLGSTYKSDTHFIFTPSFSENIAGLKFINNNPAVYSELELTEGKLLFKSFSDGFCFFNTEIYF